MKTGAERGDWKLFFGVFLLGIQQEAAAASVDFSGHGRIRFEESHLTDLENDIGRALLRIRTKASIVTHEKISLVVTPQFVKAFGESNASGFTSGAANDTNVLFHEGYIDFHPNRVLSVLAGRQKLSYGNELIFGSNDWGQVGRAFDAIRMRLDYVFGQADLLYSKIADTNTRVNGLGDRDIFGFYSSQNFGGPEQASDLYFIVNRDQSTVPKKPSYFTLGILSKDKLSFFDYYFEGTVQFGDLDWKESYQAAASIGFGLGPEEATRISVSSFVSGKDYRVMFPKIHGVFGITDVFSRRNLAGGRFGIEQRFDEKLTAGFDAFFLSKNIQSDAVYKTDGESQIPSEIGKSYIGTELDLTAKWDFYPKMNMLFGYGLMLTSQRLGSFGEKVNPRVGYVQLQADL